VFFCAVIISRMFPVISILGVPIHAVTTAQTLAWLETAVSAHTPRQICTANPEFVMTAQQDPVFHEVLNAADLVLPDGVGLLWAARAQRQFRNEWPGRPDLPHRRTGRTTAALILLGAAEGVMNAQRAFCFIPAGSGGPLPGPHRGGGAIW
jgi:N-acetylglucosaminyldiphosphoundecaprenol N-acetyl-beta-D-mannosaminyltransferase